MGTLLPLAWARAQFGLHGLALLLLMGAVFIPALARPAGLVLVLSALVLQGLLLGVILAYRRAALAFLVPAD
jgi:ABC-type spermidine/putrescine transport system permease subunit II